MSLNLSRVSWVWVLIGWTVLLWLSRLRNVVIDDDLSSGGRAIRIGVVVIFVALAVAAAAAVRQQKGLPGPRTVTARTVTPWVLVAFLIWTVGYWVVRGTGILIDGDYSWRFKAIHTGLMVVSLTLSVLTARQLRARR